MTLIIIQNFGGGEPVVTVNPHRELLGHERNMVDAAKILMEHAAPFSSIRIVVAVPE